ncbi:DUF819 family protein [Porticoccaceae bacterium LTM1]|nr:DUF819 family protein [Porticoccaceae bacterium LTM1]
MNEASTALITSDAVTLGILALCLGFVFYTSKCGSDKWNRFYRVIPALLVCYLLPSLLNTFGVIDSKSSNLYYVASRYLLPASLVLLTLSIDLKKIVALGPKALIMFGTATLGIVVGGPIAILLVGMIFPDIINTDLVWKALSTVAGSWIGGGANMTAMKELFEVDDNMFGAMLVVDIIVANIWMVGLLWIASRADKIDARLGNDVSAIEDLKATVEKFEKDHARIPQLQDLMVILAIGLGATGLAHFIADLITPWLGSLHSSVVRDLNLDSPFFWLVVIATTIGLVLSFTKAKLLEGAGASKVGSVFIYFLVATIGMKMDLMEIFKPEYATLFLVGLVWMAFHVGLLFLVGRWIKSPMFFLAVGSKANVGGAASAPVVAAAFHPSLAPVGVLLAVLGYALGTYAAWFCAQLMRLATGG